MFCIFPISAAKCKDLKDQELLQLNFKPASLTPDCKELKLLFVDDLTKPHFLGRLGPSKRVKVNQ